MRSVAVLIVLAAAALLSSAPASAQEQAAAAVASATVVAAVTATATDAAGAAPSATAAVTAVVEPPKATAPRAPVTRLIATIDLTTQRMMVAIDGKTAHVWPISSGRAGYLTPTGSFRPQWASRMHYSKKYDDAPMPYSVFFNGGIATHGTSAVGMLGQPASHGCIRLTTANAEAFFTLVNRYGFAATRIHVRGSTPAPAVARRRTNEDVVRLARSEPRRDVRPAAPRIAGARFHPAQPPRVVQYYPAPGYGYGNQVYVVRSQPRYLFSNW